MIIIMCWGNTCYVWFLLQILDLCFMTVNLYSIRKMRTNAILYNLIAASIHQLLVGSIWLYLNKNNLKQTNPPKPKNICLCFLHNSCEVELQWHYKNTLQEGFSIGLINCHKKCMIIRNSHHKSHRIKRTCGRFNKSTQD